MLEDIFLVLNLLIELSHITAECQKRLFKIILVVDDMKRDNQIVFQLGHYQLWVLVLENYLCICKLHLIIEFLLSSDLILFGLKYAVEAVNVLGCLYLFYLSFCELVYFEKLVDLLIEAVENTLHLDFALL